MRTGPRPDLPDTEGSITATGDSLSDSTTMGKDYYGVLGVPAKCLAGGHQARLPKVGTAVPPGQEPGRGRGGEVQGDRRGLRGAVRPGQTCCLRQIWRGLVSDPEGCGGSSSSIGSLIATSRPSSSPSGRWTPSRCSAPSSATPTPFATTSRVTPTPSTAYSPSRGRTTTRPPSRCTSGIPSCRTPSSPRPPSSAPGEVCLTTVTTCWTGPTCTPPRSRPITGAAAPPSTSRAPSSARTGPSGERCDSGVPTPRRRRRLPTTTAGQWAGTPMPTM